MRRAKLAALLGVMVVSMAATGCGGEEEVVPEGAMIDLSLPDVQLRPLLEAMEDDDAVQLVATVRGPGQIGYLQPQPRREGSEVVTTFVIKNVSLGHLAGFKIDEFWYNDAGDTLTGSSYRMKQPFMQDQVIQVTLHTPRSPNASRSNWEFSHQGGVIEANLFDEVEEPTLLIDGDEVTEVEPEAEEEADPAA